MDSSSVSSQPLWGMKWMKNADVAFGGTMNPRVKSVQFALAGTLKLRLDQARDPSAR